jgi:predicted O-methyltransferase YrrM
VDLGLALLHRAAGGRLRGVGRAELDQYLAGQEYGAEVGVWKGAHAAALLAAGPALHLWCVDAYAELPGYREAKNNAKLLDFAKRKATKAIAPYQDRAVIIERPSTAAAGMFRPASLDFVFIDADHGFDAVLADLRAWSAVVRPGGLVCGHDYGTNLKRAIDVEAAVQAFTREAAIESWFVLDDEPDGSLPCFAWVKP